MSEGVGIFCQRLIKSQHAAQDVASRVPVEEPVFEGADNMHHDQAEQGVGEHFMQPLEDDEPVVIFPKELRKVYPEKNTPSLIV